MIFDLISNLDHSCLLVRNSSKVQFYHCQWGKLWKKKKIVERKNVSISLDFKTTTFPPSLYFENLDLLLIIVVFENSPTIKEILTNNSWVN